MNDAEQPNATRKEDARTWSSQDCEGAKPYLAWTVRDGKLSNVHMPSSARDRTGETKHPISTAAIKADSNDLHLLFMGSFLLVLADDPFKFLRRSSSPRLARGGRG